MKRMDLLLVLIGLLVVVLTGCDCTPEQAASTKLTLLEPIDGNVVDSVRPVFHWDYHGCWPKGFRVRVWGFYQLSQNKFERAYGGEKWVHTGLKRQTAFDQDFTVGGHYEWVLTAAAGDKYYWSGTEFFIVGPACQAPSLIAPEPTWPTGEIAYDFLPFIWEYNDQDCTPSGYQLQVSMNPGFTDIVKDERQDNPIKHWEVHGIPVWCTEYYWRVRAIDGAANGPWSDVLSFQLMGNCLGQVLPADEMGAIPEVASVCSDGEVTGNEECDGDDLGTCLPGQICVDCQCAPDIGDGPGICVYKALQNSNCRESEYSESDLVETLTKGDAADLIALNPEYTHGLFELESGKQCWIWLGLMDGDENPFHNCPLEIVDPPTAPPAASPTTPPVNACTRDMDQRACIAAGGEWIVGDTTYCDCPEE